MRIKQISFLMALAFFCTGWIAALGQAPVNSSLGVSTSVVSFATPVAVTQVASALEAVTVTNRGNSSLPLTVAVSGDFTVQNGCVASLAPGRTCVVQVGFAPSQPGDRDGILTLGTGSGYSPTTVSLTGTGLGLLAASNETLGLWQTLLGEPVVVWYKVQQPIAYLTAATNSNLFGVALVAETGSGHGSLPADSFARSAGGNCNNCWLGVQFYSQMAGTVNATLALGSNVGGGTDTVGLVGTALPVVGLLMAPVMQDFGTVAVHSSTAGVTFSVTDLLMDAAAVTVQSVGVTRDFVLLANTTGGATCSGSLAATASCYVEVGFAPTGTGGRDGTLTIVTSGGTVTAGLTGTGTDDPGVALNPVELNFASVPGLSAAQQTVVVTNTGRSSVEVGSVTSSDPSFGASSACGALSAGASCSIEVTFTPQSGTVAGKLSVPVSSGGGGQATVYSVALAGMYTSQSAGLEIVAGQANFAAAGTGSLGATREFTLNNLTSKALDVSLALPREFPLAAPSACTTLAAGGSCTFSVSFLPVTGGSLTGSVVAVGMPQDGSANVQGLAYMLGYGAATGSLMIKGNTIPNSPLSFGQVSSGQSRQQIVTLTNNGSGTVTIHRLTTQPPFYSTSNCGAALAPNASCMATLQYAPVDEVSGNGDPTARNDVGTLVVESDAASSPDAMDMTGAVVPMVSSTPQNLLTLNSLGLSESALTFANTHVGNVSALQTVVLANTGTTTLQISSVTASTDFTVSNPCTTLVPATTCSISVTFTPTTATHANLRTGTLEISSNAGTSLEFVSLLGISVPAPLTLSPAALDFGTVSVGASDALTVMVTNVKAAPVTFLGLTATGDYTVAAGSCPATGVTLAAGASCVLTVTFAPKTMGNRTGVLSLDNDATQLPLTVALTGNATEAQLRVTPGALEFGSISGGFPASLTLTLLNTGDMSVTGIANAISGSDAGDFAVTLPCSVTTLAPNQGCTETVTFLPAASGARAATLRVASSDPQGPAVVALSGTGVAAGSFALTVNGSSAATLTVASGAPGTYALLLTPLQGFAGPVALTCTPVTAGQYASCSLLASTLTLESSAQESTATINTITTEARGMGVVMAGLLLMPLVLLNRVRQKKGLVVLGIAAIACAGVSGCGGGGVAVNNNVRTTPAGTYQYKVTASATSGAAVTSSVMLTLVVQ